MAQATLPQAGDLIAGKYRIERELSSGGMGAVYVARHTATERAFALKLMRAELAGDADAEARFTREAKLASSVEHPAIIEVYDIGRHEGFPYMVMKLLEGESLGERIKGGPIPHEKAVAIMLPVLHGIAAAHASGVVHRDLKPDNIFLCDEGGTVAPKILDFGISKLMEPDGSTMSLTSTGMSLGTPLYMSPEQVRGAKDVDTRTDIYALGVILYEMLTGRLPYEATNYADLVLKIITGHAQGVREFNKDIPETLEAIVRRAMEVDREDRFPNAERFAQALVDMKLEPLRVSSRMSVVSKPESPTPFSTEGRESLPTPPTRRVGLAVAAVGALVLALGAWALWPSSDDAPPPAQAGAGEATPPPVAAEDTPLPPKQAPPAEEALAKPTPEPEPQPVENSAWTTPVITDEPSNAEPAEPEAAARPTPTREDEAAAEARRERRRQQREAARAAEEAKKREQAKKRRPIGIADDGLIDPFK